MGSLSAELTPWLSRCLEPWRRAREGAGGPVDRLWEPPIWGFFLCLLVGPPFYVQAVFVNRCGSPRVCDFVCDCWDCSDENQCGELISFLFLRDEFKAKLQQKRRK